MGKKHACGLCMESDRLGGHVVNDDMAAVSESVLHYRMEAFYYRMGVFFIKGWKRFSL